MLDYIKRTPHQCTQIPQNHKQYVCLNLKCKSKLPNDNSTIGYSHIKTEKLQNNFSVGGPVMKIQAPMGK